MKGETIVVQKKKRWVSPPGLSIEHVEGIPLVVHPKVKHPGVPLKYATLVEVLDPPVCFQE